MTCYDLRFPEVGLALRRRGAQVLCYPSAFTLNTGAPHWGTSLPSSSRSLSRIARLTLFHTLCRGPPARTSHREPVLRPRARTSASSSPCRSTLGPLGMLTHGPFLARRSASTRPLGRRTATPSSSTHGAASSRRRRIGRPSSRRRTRASTTTPARSSWPRSSSSGSSRCARRCRCGSRGGTTCTRSCERAVESADDDLHRHHLADNETLSYRRCRHKDSRAT